MKKELKILIEKNSSELSNSNKTFEDIYEIMFRSSDRVLAEYNDGFRIYRLTYTEVRTSIEKVSAALYERIGATHGFVGIEMENCVEWIEAFWAILRSGNKPYLINCRHTTSLSNGIIKTLGIKYVVGLKPTELDAEYIDFKSLTGGSPDFKGEFENEIALSSSATSMKEKICFYTGTEISNQILNAKSILSTRSQLASHYHGSLKQLAFLPFYHVFGLTAVYFWFTFFGRTLVFLRDLSGDTILKTCRKHEVTHVFAVPLLWHSIEKQVLKQVAENGEKKQKKFERGLRLCTALQNVFPFLGARLSMRIMSEVTDQLFGKSIRFCISGGSYIRDSALKLFNGLGYPLHNGFGMTEIGITSVELRSRPKYRNLNSIGKPFESVEYKISEKGTLLVKGESVSKRMTVEGLSVTNDGWFDTGDVMYCKDGYYYIQGRMSDTVIGENGENINPDIVEQYFTLNDVENFSVLGLGDKENEKLSIVVQVNRYFPQARLLEIANKAYADAAVLPMTMQIRDFYFTFDDVAPKTAVKIGRKYLKDAIASGNVTLIPFAEIKKAASEADGESDFDPDSPLAVKIRSIIANVLNVSEESVTDDAHVIFDLGATSLVYFNLISELAKEFSIASYSDKDNYCYTLREFCRYIERHI